MPDLPDLSLQDLQRLAVILGRSIGMGFARTMLDAEEHAATQLPPSKAQTALDTITLQLEDWAREAVKQPRTKESRQAKLLEAVMAYLQAAREEQRDGP